MAYRVVQREPHIATRIEYTFSSRDEACEEVEAYGFELDDYRIEQSCTSCGGWYETLSGHPCNPVVVEPTGWQPYEPGTGRLRREPSSEPALHRERSPRRHHRCIRASVVVRDYPSRSVVAYALELGLMVSTKPLRFEDETVIVTVYGTRKKVYKFQGYAARANY